MLCQVSIPPWFTIDTRLGSLSVHLDTPQCFSAEMYSVDLNISGKPEDDKVKYVLVSLSLFCMLDIMLVYCPVIVVSLLLSFFFGLNIVDVHF